MMSVNCANSKNKLVVVINLMYVIIGVDKALSSQYYLRGIVHSKMKIVVINHPHVVPTCMTDFEKCGFFCPYN